MRYSKQIQTYGFIKTAEKQGDKGYIKNALAQYDKLIARDIAAVCKKYFPYSTVNEEKVLKLARMLIANEKAKAEVGGE